MNDVKLILEPHYLQQNIAYILHAPAYYFWISMFNVSMCCTLTYGELYSQGVSLLISKLVMDENLLLLKKIPRVLLLILRIN
jgi:hypothetical protein